MNRRALTFEPTGWNSLDRSFGVVASTSAPVLCTETDPDGNTTEYLEALEGWDLRRITKNNLVFEGDASSSDNVIGDLHNIEQVDGVLKMTVKLAPLDVNERTWLLERRIRQGFLRGVSVVFQRGERTDEMRDGKMTRVYRGNVLCEVSIVPFVETTDAGDEPSDQSKAERALPFFATRHGLDDQAALGVHFDAGDPSNQRKAPIMTKSSPVLQARDQVARRQAAGPRVDAGGRLSFRSLDAKAEPTSDLLKELTDLIALAKRESMKTSELIDLLERLTELRSDDAPTRFDAKDGAVIGKGGIVSRARDQAAERGVQVVNGRLARGGSAA